MKRSNEFLVLNLVCMVFSIICCIFIIISKTNFYETIFIGAQWAFIGIQWMCIYNQFRYMKQENKGTAKTMLGVIVP